MDESADAAMIDGKSEGLPVLVEVTRGVMVESHHHGSAVVVDADGRVVLQWGNIEQPVFPRSAIKPIQAVPLVETGALGALGGTEEELALACASHSGEPVHVDTVRAWLHRMGLAEGDLECGATAPLGAESAHDLVRHGRSHGPLHNNCSGKHAGMLATALHKGEPTMGYIRFDHPVQQRILGVIEQVCGVDLSAAPRAIDGCSIPVYGIPLGNLALGMARLADPNRNLPETRIRAAERVRRAWGGYPHLVAGSNRFDTRVITAARGQVLVKTGAEGVHCACLPELGLGVALKIADGATRAAEVAMANLLRRLGALEDRAWVTLADLLETPLRNAAGREIGFVRWVGS